MKYIENLLLKCGEKLYKMSAKIILRKLKNKEELNNQDKEALEIILEQVIRGNNEE